MVKDNNITNEMREVYYNRLEEMHAREDARYVHSLPMHYFTHLGNKPLVDKLIRCERLKDDTQELLMSINAGQKMKDMASRLKNQNDSEILDSLTEMEIKMANKLYELDFKTFGYKYNNTARYDGLPSYYSEDIDILENSEKIKWHWGPEAKKSKSVLRATR